MTEYKSLFLHTLQERGFIHQVTNGEALDALLLDPKGPPTAAYIGFDATAKSLHVGSLVQIMMLRWLQKCGHKPIVLMGGGTTKIGDPSGKDEARKMITEDDITANIKGIGQVFAKFLRFGEKETDALMVNNAEWLDKINYIDFLRDYGRHFSINRMLTMESVKMRLEREQNLSFLEFNYMLLQAYDFVELHNRYNVRLQMGGSDQWGNITSGIELQSHVWAENLQNQIRQSSNEVTHDERKKLHEDYMWSHYLFGLTTPLMTTASGAKMGKTASGAVWLNENMQPAYQYYQFWRNTEDADVGKFLRLFTELPIDEIQGLESLKGAEINEAKKILAFEATKLCHGDEAANNAAEAARQLFERGGLSENMLTVPIPATDFANGIPAYVLMHRVGLAGSAGDARRLIRGGGGKINDVKIEKEDQLITKEHFVDGSLKLSAGKKHHAKIVITA